jgi:hypothetical protein
MPAFDPHSRTAQPPRLVWIIAIMGASISGCASPSPQACMLVGACASQTNSVRVHEQPAKALSSICFEGPHVLSTTPLTIAKAATGGASATINDAVRKSSQESARTIVEVYRKETKGAVLEKLRALGIGASDCAGTAGSDVGRLVTTIASIKTDTGGLGWKAQLNIHATLQVGEPRSPPVWAASFTTGNKTAVGLAPDRENVDAFAENLIDEVGRSGWIARR